MLIKSQPARKGGKSVSFRVQEQALLFEFLFRKIGSMSKTAVKSLLAKGAVYVNDQIQTRFDHPLSPGDGVRVEFSGEVRALKHSKLSILYEDDYIVVVNKAAGLLSVATDRNEEATAYRILMNHFKRQNKNNRIYVVHRLDRETSGLLIFAKSKEVQQMLQQNWHSDVKEKRYVALAEGIVEDDRGTIHTWLKEDPKSKIVFSCDYDNGGYESITHYEVVERLRKYTLLNLFLETGRKNQIRVHLQTLGHPVAGDYKYGAQVSPIGRMALHAQVLRLIHPVTFKEMRFEAPLPARFGRIK